jgi:hypothetical protein
MLKKLYYMLPLTVKSQERSNFQSEQQEGIDYQSNHKNHDGLELNN